jgi:hypothetical protein
LDKEAVGSESGLWYGLIHGEAIATSCAWRVVSYHYAGLGRRDIFHEDRDRLHFLELLSELVDRYGVILHAYVLMDNHDHLLIETPNGNAYPAYAGYAVAPAWLTREKLWLRVARAGDQAAAAYRKQIEDYLKQGSEEGAFERLTQALAIGSTAGTRKHANMTPQAVSRAATRMRTLLSKDRPICRTAEKILRLAHLTMKESQ